MARHKSSGGLGFKNFRDFNIAMLGKQAWRFLCNPTSLVTRIYRARYFGDTDFLHAKMGNNPSYIWRSILEARELIISGVRWRLGSGENILIAGQPWLLEEGNPYISTHIPALENKIVASLMVTGRKEWDVEVVKDIFNDRDQKCILSIQISSDAVDDMLFWRFEQSGVYSVKSAYKFLQEQKGH